MAAPGARHPQLARALLLAADPYGLTFACSVAGAGAESRTVQALVTASPAAFET